MQNLFSHAHEPDYISPRESEHFEQSVVVDVPDMHAFDGFVDSIHLWWPVVDQSVFGDGSHVSLLSDYLVEDSEDDEEAIWADVVELNAPTLLSLHWTLGEETLGSHDVDMKFESVHGTMTRVTISWEQNPGLQSDSDKVFICDWPLILARYARFMGGAVPLD